jgi:hypothetical protein
VPRRGTTGSCFAVAGGALSPRTFLLGSRTNCFGDLATGTVTILAFGVSQEFLRGGRPGDTCVTLVVLTLTGLAFGGLHRFRLRGRTNGPVVWFRPRVRSRWGRL